MLYFKKTQIDADYKSQINADKDADQRRLNLIFYILYFIFYILLYGFTYPKKINLETKKKNFFKKSELKNFIYLSSM